MRIFFFLLCLASWVSAKHFGTYRAYETERPVGALRAGPGAGEFRVSDANDLYWLLRPKGADLLASFTDTAGAGFSVNPLDSAAWPAGCVWGGEDDYSDKPCSIRDWRKSPQGDDLLLMVKTDSSFEVWWGLAQKGKRQWRTLLALPSWVSALASFDGSGKEVAVLTENHLLDVWSREAVALEGAQSKGPGAMKPPVRRILHPFSQWPTAFRRLTMPPRSPLTSVLSPAFYQASSLQMGSGPGLFLLGHGEEGVEIRYGKDALEPVGEIVAMDDDTVALPGDGVRLAYGVRANSYDPWILMEKRKDGWIELKRLDERQTVDFMSQGYVVRTFPDYREEKPTPGKWEFLDKEGRHLADGALGKDMASYLRNLEGKMTTLIASPSSPWALLKIDTAWQVLDWSQDRFRVVAQKQTMPTGAFFASIAPDGRQVVLWTAAPEGIVVYHGQAQTSAQGVQLTWKEIARAGGAVQIVASFDPSSRFIGLMTDGGDVWLAPVDSLKR